MSLAPRLDLRQSQTLLMTPRLQQAIKLLALSNLEIEAVIADEIEKNPLLESSAAEDGTIADRDAASEQRDTTSESLDADVVAERFDDGPSGSIVSSSGSPQAVGASGGGEGAIDTDAFAEPAISLAEHLLGQAGNTLSGADALIARHLIGQIDEAGYLTAPTREVAEQLGMPLARVEAILAVIQTFDPTGVGARDLAECLALQAKEADRYDPCMAMLIANLELLARGDIQRLKRMCQVDDEDMADMIRELRGYDPKPGCRYGGEPPPPVTPDLHVTRTRTGWAIEINAETLPRVLVNRNYYVELFRGAHDKAAKAWLNECLASADWLVKALDQRQRTIIRVATEIVRRQEAFFLRGVAHLKPLTLRQVADAIDMHESTVSRVTSNKYLSCARGIYELKFFFTSAIASADGGEALSAAAVKAAIRALISAEGAKILSDDALVERLKATGFDVARRTVAKYREALGLGSSVQRRRARALEGS